MIRKRHIEITVEHQWVILRRSASTPVWCVECPAPIQMITPDEAALLASVSTRAIYALVETEQLHYTEMPEGPLMKLFVCPNSLSTIITTATFRGLFKEKHHA